MLLVIVFGAIFMNTYMNKQIYFSTYSIKSSRINQELSGYEIMQITDLHSIRSEEQKKMLIEKIKKKTPDIIVITGDLIDSNQYNLQNVHFELFF